MEYRSVVGRNLRCGESLVPLAPLRNKKLFTTYSRSATASNECFLDGPTTQPESWGPSVEKLRKSGPWVVALLLLLFLPWSHARRPVAKSFTMPIYGKAPRPIALLRIGTISLTHEKRGFFRMGMFPRAHLEGLAVELIFDSEQKDLLPVLTSRLQRLSRNRWNGSGFQWGRQGELPVLVAERIRPAPGEWLLEGVSFRLGGHRIQAPRARLQSRTDQTFLLFDNYQIPLADLSRSRKPPAPVTKP